MAQAPPLSAFAKRRRLNNGTPTSASLSPSSGPSDDAKVDGQQTRPRSGRLSRGPPSTVDASSTRQSKPAPPTLLSPSALPSVPAVTEHRCQAGHSVGEIGSEADADVENGDGVQGGDSGDESDVNEENSFGPLEAASLVNHIPSREIEAVSSTAVKVRLAQGQRCIVTGFAQLWVREGSISVHGATLDESAESPGLYRIYTTPSHPTWPIVAISKSAEFQLESIEGPDFLIAKPTSSLRTNQKSGPGLVNETGQTSARSFSIAGSAFEDDSPMFRPGQEFDIDSLQKILPRLFNRSLGGVAQPLGPSKHDGSSPGQLRLLTGGHRCADFTKGILNHMLTRKSPQGHVLFPDGVLLLDTDPRSPEFTQPGTVGLTLVKECIFGPSFTHPACPYSGRNRVLRTSYFGLHKPGLGQDRFTNSLKVLLEFTETTCSAAGLQGVPLVVKATGLIENFKTNELMDICRGLMLDLVVWFHNSSSQIHTQTGKGISQAAECAYMSVESRGGSSRMTSTALDHQLLTRSHLHVVGYGEDQPIWSRTAILAGGQTSVYLTYGREQADINFVVVGGGHIEDEFLLDALEGAIVAVLVDTFPEDGDGDGATCDTVIDDSGEGRITGSYTSDHGRESSASPLADSSDRLSLPLPLPLPTPTSMLMELVPATMHCLGIGVIGKIDEDGARLELITPVPEGVLKDWRRRSCRLGLALEKPDMEDRFGRQWLFQETSI